MNRAMKFWTLALLFSALTLGFCTPAAANRTAELFQEANSLFEQQQFEQAAQRYEQLLQAGKHAAAVYFNLGNCYYRTGKLGKAILNYERALLLEPHNRDFRYNLELASSKTTDEFAQLPPFFLAAWWNGLRSALSVGGWTVLGLLFLWLGIGGLALWRFAPARRRRKQGFYLGWCLLLLSLLPFSLAASRKHWQEKNKSAILQEQRMTLRSAPDDEAPQLMFLHEGLKVKVVDEIGEWGKVLLSNGEQGWLPIQEFEYVRL